MTKATPARIERREMRRRELAFLRDKKRRQAEANAKFDAAHAKADARRDMVYDLLRSRGLVPGRPGCQPSAETASINLDQPATDPSPSGPTS